MWVSECAYISKGKQIIVLKIWGKKDENMRRSKNYAQVLMIVWVWKQKKYVENIEILVKGIHNLGS